MSLAGIAGRGWVRALGVAGAAAAGYVFGVTADRVTAQPAAAPPAADKRVVAYIYGTTPVTREELGDFLIARGGHEKLDLVVNKKIIDLEAARRGLTVTALEVQAALAEDVRGMGIELKDFERHILPRYGKTLFEWTEDVVRPRILLGKMCKDRVKVTEDDLQKAFANRHGERRQAKIICWSSQDLKVAQKQWAEARAGETQAERDANFDRVARMQADPNLAASAGLVAPLGQFPDVEDDRCTKVLFSLKVGEMSELFETPAGVMCVKLVAVIPPDPKAKLEGALRDGLKKEVEDKKLSAEIPKFFTDLKKAAQPILLLKGAPTAAENREGVRQIIETGGLNPTPKP
ncbi:MAG: hypothetical protein C0501_13500 [Isosphaera sp.]|nr:hypothetical protein [Isosphaera sp.]